MNVQGKYALVTGGSRGIGRETVLALAQRGARVLFTYRTGKAEAEELVRSLGTGRAECFACDVRKPGDIEALASGILGRGIAVDVLVNNAGGPARGGIQEASAELWQDSLSLHVLAPALFTRAFSPGMKERRLGVIVNIASVAALRGIPGGTVYSAVKGAVIAMTRSVARELAEFNVRAVSISPGIIRTAFHAAMTPETKAFNEQNRIPLHREGTPAEVAHLIASLIENDYCTGDNYVVDGGLTMRMV